MKDVTILIQGRVTPDAIRYYNQHYKDYNVVISTWNGERVINNALPIVRSQKPIIKVPQNFNFQLNSTLTGLKLVETPYVIKMRGDEWWSGMPYIAETIKKDPEKIHCSPVFFRKWMAYGPYHISDHLIAGTTENVKLMFERAQLDLQNKVSTPISEVNLGVAYIREKESRYIVDKNLMKKHFSILDIDKLGEYKIVANAYKQMWKTDPRWNNLFVPEKWESIRNIDKL